MLVYISGPITGVEDYKDRFAAAADILMDAGYTVVNPANMDMILAGPEVCDALYLRADLKLLEICGAICMLPGWENSRGATAEYQWMKDHKKMILVCHEVDPEWRQDKKS